MKTRDLRDSDFDSIWTPVAVSGGSGLHMDSTNRLSVRQPDCSGFVMKLTSRAFPHEGAIPERHSKNGGNVSPALAWTDVPQETVSLALIVVPVVIRTTENMLKLVPDSLREAAAALGTPQWKMILMVTLRSVRAGIDRYYSDKAFAMKVIAKYTKETDPDIIERTYQFYRKAGFRRELMISEPGVQGILDFLSETVPEAKKAVPAQFFDDRFVRQLNSGR